MNIRESKTEKFLIASMSVLAFILVASFFVKEPVGVSVASADNHESEQSEKSEDDESERSEQSEDDESEASEDDESEYSEEYSESSEYSEYDADATSTTPTSVAPSGVAAPVTTQGSVTEEGAEISEDEASEMSEEMEDEVSEEEMEDESSEISEVDGYDEVVSVEGNIAEVRKKERLFGIFQIETESQVTLNDAGEVIDEKKGLWNWFLSTLSF